VKAELVDRSTVWRTLSRTALSIAGWLLVALASVALLGWVQSGDPECILDTGVFAQIRMCDPAIVGEPQSWSISRLLLILGVLAVGIACLVVRKVRRSVR
jgi:hypothetical protein